MLQMAIWRTTNLNESVGIHYKPVATSQAPRERDSAKARYETAGDNKRLSRRLKRSSRISNGDQSRHQLSMRRSLGLTQFNY